MISLIIDCSYGMKLYLIDGEKIFSRENDDEKKHTDNLLVVLDELLKQANVDVKQINNYCICTGPGSFTGIRVAISICKGLAIESDAKIFTLSNLDTFDFVNTKKALFILEGFSQFVYVRKFQNNKFVDLCLSIDEVKDLYLDGFKCFVLTEKMKQKLIEKNINSDVVLFKIVELFNKKIETKIDTEINQIEPVYLRASQAEIERNKKLGVK